MSEAPTHAAGVPTPARPQQTSQHTERMPQQSQRADETQRAEAQRGETQRGEAQRTDAQRTDVQRADGQRADAQRTDTQRTEAQRAETTQRADTQRTDAQRAEAQRTDGQRAEHQRADHRGSEPERTGHQSIGKLEDEWQAVQYEFVDDPKAAVRKADDLVTRAIEELNTRHRSLTKQLEGNSDPQTEDLRLALHRYRELFKSLVAVK
ncbi:hypothetical protein PV646_43045 [Streptomyces sp. ID05-26A]|nr:hypothetical protein [Streptomyces sp. ID05-26A]